MELKAVRLAYSEFSHSTSPSNPFNGIESLVLILARIVYGLQPLNPFNGIERDVREVYREREQHLESVQWN